MAEYISRYLLIESLDKLNDQIRSTGVPEHIINSAIKANPWFTKYYIEYSIRAISSWFRKETLTYFLNDYPERQSSPLNIGVIAAGNLPLVGFHDVLIPVLSGHAVGLKPSHRDRVLMQWLIESWIEILPTLKKRIRIGSLSESLDFLITTGSNNTARYIEADFKDIPKVIRKNRYSMAILSEEMEENEMDQLCEDILLYNGLGCRNVNNLLVMPGANWDTFIEKISNYPTERLNPLYLERVLYESSLMELLNTPFESYKSIIITSENSPGISSMGVLRKITVDNEAKLQRILDHNKSNIQCIVGRETAYGMTQRPKISDFADSVDTMKLLTDL